MRVLATMLLLPIAVRAHDSARSSAVTPDSSNGQGLPPSLVTRFRRFRGPSKSGL
jgi:hypothetical protein